MLGRLTRLVFLGFLGVIAVLSLADRAPSGTRALMRRGRSVLAEGEQRFGVDWIDRSDVPLAFDTMGHIALWAIAGFLATLAFRRRVGPLFIVVSLSVLSAGIEVGQGLLSTTRRPEFGDLVANVFGSALGTAVALLVWAAIGMFGRLTRSLAP